MAGKYDAPGELIIDDALNFDYEKFDVAVAMLVMMFFPPLERKNGYKVYITI